ncbi:TrmB family transcriptional regulator [Haloarculaceae archaeon H-GB2-1]|nr:TrmB family transcriptional regulator [Haloarculaceae archaeon H-GB1-1]MEA5386561.1 TrmB family transcriptional regulator [Haloarculaceae archaeon H-GB11]MEA5408073.1 TrmB family transcriptional regulator [Haloarculaceae archaeon H-GB2-1]
MTDDDLRSSLERLGERFDFGEYEVEAYLTVLEHGRMTASEIAERTDIPHPRVYDTVRSLADNGLVELHESRPMQVLPIDPEEAFSEIQSSLDDLIDQLERQFTAPARDSEAITLIKSRSTILRYLGDVIESAEYELMISLSADLVGRFEEELKERRDAGVTVELLVSPEEEVPTTDEYDYGEIATTTRVRRGVTTPIVAVADGTYSVYATREALRNDVDRYGVIFNRSELGFLVSAFLNTVVWTSGRTIETAESQPAFPRRYATIRRCVEDLQRYDGQFYASIRGRDVLTGKHKTVAGTVADITAEASKERAALTIETDSGLIDVGGQTAALEDIEAHEIHIGRDAPPEL